MFEGPTDLENLALVADFGCFLCTNKTFRNIGFCIDSVFTRRFFRTPYTPTFYRILSSSEGARVLNICVSTTHIQGYIYYEGIHKKRISLSQVMNVTNFGIVSNFMHTLCI